MPDSALLSVLVLLQQGAASPGGKPAPAAEFDYSFLEAAYVLVEVDGLDDELDGFSVSAALDVTDNVFGAISLLSTSGDVGGVDLDYDVLELGLGLHEDLHERLDVLATGALLLADAEALGDSDDETGYRLRGGVRFAPAADWELAGGFGFVDLDDAESFFDASGLYRLTDLLHVRLGVEFGEDGEAYALGLRLYPGLG